MGDAFFDIDEWAFLGFLTALLFSVFYCLE